MGRNKHTYRGNGSSGAENNNRGVIPPSTPMAQAGVQAVLSPDKMQILLPPPAPRAALAATAESTGALKTIDETVKQLTEILGQINHTFQRLKDEAGDGRVAAQVRDLLGADPSALRAAYEAQGRLSADLKQIADQIAQHQDHLRGLSGRTTPEQVRASIDESLQPALVQVGGDLDSLRRHLEGLDQRVSPAAVDETVRDAAQVLTRTYAQELKQRLAELQQAFDFLDDHKNQVKALIEQFGPGGAQVLQQENRELREALDRRREDLDKAQAEQRRCEGLLIEREREIFQLKAAQGSLASIDELERRRQEVATREQKLASWEALQEENRRQESDLRALKLELEKYNSKIFAEQLALSEKGELQRLRQEHTEARAAQDALEQRRVRLEQDLRALREENRRLADRLRAVQQAEEQAALRQERIEALDKEVRALGQLCERQLRDLEQCRREDLLLQQQVQDQQARLQQERKQQCELEAEWRARQEADLHARVQASQEQARRWGEEHARALCQQTEADLAEAEQQRVVLQQQLQQREQDMLGLRAESHRRAVENEALQHQIERLSGSVERARAALLHDAERERTALQADHQQREERHRQQVQADQEAALELAARARAQVDQAAAEHQQLQRELAVLSGRRGELQEQLQHLEQRRADLRERVLPREERVQQLHQPIFATDQLPPIAGEPERPISERGWLDRIERAMQDAGFRFSPGLLRAFHTSLKVARSSPLTILSGISGTGKSELPRLYADLGGLSFLPIPVQPSWDSPSDLFGFFNYSDGRLKAEPLARLLAQVNDQKDPLRQGLSLVLLDEMNLARVEYYFAELLSRLEARRAVGGGAGQRERASVHLDVGAGEAERLYLDERVLFVGTMNEDESTQSLSAKVMDRACMLSFPGPRDMHIARQDPARPWDKRLSFETWKSWVRECEPGEISEELNQLNEIMDDLRHPFGHRLFRAIHAYIANYPEAVNKEEDRNAAWADQWAMKILPRLKGLECDDDEVRKGLDRLQKKLPERLGEGFERARRGDYFSWAGSSALYAEEARG